MQNSKGNGGILYQYYIVSLIYAYWYIQTTHLHKYHGIPFVLLPTTTFIGMLLDKYHSDMYTYSQECIMQNDLCIL